MTTALETRQLNHPNAGRIRPTNQRRFHDPVGHARPKNPVKVSTDRYGNWRVLFRAWIKQHAAAKKAG